MTKEKIKKMLIRTALAIVLLAGVCGSCSYVNKLAKIKDDHAVEEMIEDKILEEFHIDIDLTPYTEEIE